mmetsp:Transcript_15310/g.42816  ORF Transcript_15310/g.42816 Transcript_15310/m.42816 type:complete len:341 (-) Transcript_15310:232-1254(-)
MAVVANTVAGWQRVAGGPPSPVARLGGNRGAALRSRAGVRLVRAGSSSSREEAVLRASRPAAAVVRSGVAHGGGASNRGATLPLASAGLIGTTLAASLLACPAASAAVADMSSQLGAALTIPGVVGDSPLTEGFVSGFLLILFSEIGDKTFFLAMLLALQQSKTEVFVGTFGALAVMTVISVGLGQVLHQVDEILPPSLTNVPLDDVLAIILLVVFGIQTLQAAGNAEESAAEEREEAQEEVEKFRAGQSLGFILSTFALVFAAEWGDKSFIATIALAAASSPLGVVLGAIGGHGVATLIAVTFGSVLSNYVSEKTVQYVGGSLFLVFAAATLVDLVVQT